jgi:hypothetical protein
LVEELKSIKTQSRVWQQLAVQKSAEVEKISEEKAELYEDMHARTEFQEANLEEELAALVSALFK